MKRFVQSKRNPNPPWPSVQPVVVVPPGVSPMAVGIRSEKTYSLPQKSAQSSPPSFNTSTAQMTTNPSSELTDPTMSASQAGFTESVNQENRTEFLMGREMPRPEMPIQQQDFAYGSAVLDAQPNGVREICGREQVNCYLTQHLGQYVKIEFLFGEQTHIEKTGILETVGENFVVIREEGFGNRLVASVSNIKFINIYTGNDKTQSTANRF